MSRIVLTLGPSTGGIGRHVAGLAAAARSHDAEVWIGGPGETLARFGLDDGRFGLVDLSARGGIGQLGRVLRDSVLVHAHGLRAASWTGVAAPWKLPMLVTWHNQRQHGATKGRRDAVIERYVSRRADLNLCVSPDLVSTVVSHHGKARLSPLGPPLLAPPTRSRDQIRAALKVSPATRVVLALSRLHQQKGLDVLIEAMTSLPFEAILVVAGVGPDAEALREQAKRARLSTRWLGQRGDVANLLLAADVMAMPSRWEGSPFALHEALQAGCPVVASSVGGIPNLVNDGAALVPPNDPSALRTALVAVLTDSELAAVLTERAISALDTWPDEEHACELVLQEYERWIHR